MDATATATYVYCIVHAASAPSTARAPRGLPGARRPAIAPVARSLWLVAAHVPLELYGPGPLESSLRDAQWVTDVAVAHEAVVEFFVRQAGATVIPMKLFTMFSSEKRAVDETRARRRDLDAVIARIAGCEEWGVRITRRSGAPPPPSKHTRSASGTAFLTAKKAARDDLRQSASAAAEAADLAYTALAAVARDARRRQDAPEGATSPPLLDAAFLVPAAGRSRFKATVRKLAAAATAGTDITLTGPWPSYNFIQPESNS